MQSSSSSLTKLLRQFAHTILDATSDIKERAKREKGLYQNVMKLMSSIITLMPEPFQLVLLNGQHKLELFSPIVDWLSGDFTESPVSPLRKEVLRTIEILAATGKQKKIFDQLRLIIIIIFIQQSKELLIFLRLHCQY